MKWIKNNLILVVVSSLLLAGLFWEFVLSDFIKPSIEIASLDPSTQETPTDLLDDTTEDPDIPKLAEKLYVDIKGEIYKPGVYLVNPDERVIDVIQSAGGFTSEADENQINLAEKVYDEMVIFVPNESDEINRSFQTNESDGRININQATESEFEQLPGIGAVRAATIVQYREENGPFTETAELQNISGIGAKTFEQLEEHIFVR